MKLTIRDSAGQIASVPDEIKDDVIYDGIMCNITKLIAMGYTVEMSAA